jgi:hypothetical protein
MDQDILAKEAQVDNLYQEGIALQAQTIRNLGTPTVVDGIVVSLTDEGKVYHNIALVDQTVANKLKEGVILDTKEKEAKATVHKILADTYTNYGSFTYAVGEGMLNVCGEGGDISNGDLIVTSSIKGKGMKQVDGIVMNYTVAKARGNHTFTSATEVKMIPCIYLCG